MSECKHEAGETSAGQATYQLTGICPKCKLDLDEEYRRVILKAQRKQLKTNQTG